jgi:divalent metal cation (Fe/Co/Zn/Cd) transporter
VITGVAIYGFGASVRTAVLIGSALALSSTAIVLQLLAEQRMLHTEYGRASFAAALMMTLASVVLMAQARALIAGRALPNNTVRNLCSSILELPGVEAVNRLAAVYAGTSEVLVDAGLDLVEELDTTSIEALLDKLEERVRAVAPDTERVSVNLNSPPPGRLPRRR